MNWYNEIDPFAAQTLRNLIAAGLIAPGVVDERSIEDINPHELTKYVQCHFFAGIGVWSYALRRAGWPDDRPVWTGSCPCQPFSTAGKGAGFADERHLWPDFFHLIKERRPTTVFGEQVASKDADPWIDLVCADLEGVGYAVGAVPFPSAGVGAPHIRDRLYWVADDDDERLERRGRAELRGGTGKFAIGPCGDVGRMAHANVPDLERNGPSGGKQSVHHGGGFASGARSAGPTNGFWQAADWLKCRDGAWRPVEPGTFPLAHGVANRMGKLRGYGNAINAEAARVFIEAYLGT